MPGSALTTRAADQTTAQRFPLVSHLISRAFVQWLAPKGVSFGQLLILLCLWKVDSITQKDLSERVLSELVRLSNDVDRAALDGLSHAEWHILDTLLGRLIRTLEWHKALIE